MPVSDARKRANKKYDDAHIKYTTLKTPIPEREKIDEAAAELGMPVSGFCRKCIQYCIDNHIDPRNNNSQ